MSSRSDITSSRSHFAQTLAVLLLSRIALNLQFRMVYPFLPAISRGLGVPLETTSLLLTMRSLVSATSPLYGFLADRHGRRIIMYAGLLALVLGSLLVGVSRSFPLAVVAFALLGLTKASYDPAAQAYVADVVPYERRGRVLGILELAWALSWLIGIPAGGFLITAGGWRAPFWFMAGLGLISVILMWRLCPNCGAVPRLSNSDGVPGPGLRPPPFRSAAMALAVTCLLIMANENVFVVYGAFMESRFRLPVTTLGIVSVVISLAELAAEGASAGLTDRLGKRRAVLGGLLLNMAAYLLLPQSASTLEGTLVGVALIFLTFEFSIVSLIPLVSELAPHARGRVMALNVAAMAMGRAISSLTGPRLWMTGGLTLNTTFSAALILLAAAILWRGVREA